MKNIFLFTSLFVFALTSQAQVIDSLSVSPCDTAEGINIDIVIFGNSYIECINQDVSIIGNEIDLTFCYFKSDATVVEWDNQFIHIPAEPGEYNLNIIIYSSTTNDSCTYTEMSDSTTIPISTLGILSPNTEADLSSIVSVYPNPAYNIASIETKNNIQIQSMTLFDMLGNKVLISISDIETFNLTQIESGVYILQIETNKGRLVKRIIKK